VLQDQHGINTNNKPRAAYKEEGSVRARGMSVMRMMNGVLHLGESRPQAEKERERERGRPFLSLK